MIALLLLAQFFPNVQVNQGPGGGGLLGSGPTYGSGQRTSFARGDTFYLTWSENLSGSDGDIMFAFSTDAGATWSTPVRVDDAGDGDTTDQQYPCICVQGDGTIYIAYRDWSPGHASIKLARSTDEGTTWSVSVLDTVASNHNLPSVWARNDTLFLAWQDDRFGDFDILFSVSPDGGASWSEPAVINDVASGLQREPSLGAFGDTLYLAWADFRNSGSSAWDIYFSRSTDKGATWSPNQRLNDDPGDAWQVAPSLGVDRLNGRVYVAWLDGRNISPWNIYISRSTDGGMTWATNAKVDDLTSEPVGGADHPSVWVADGILYVAWQDDREGQWHIYFDYDRNLGGNFNFGTDIQVDENQGDSKVTPTVAGSGTSVVVAWSDNRNTGSLVYDVYASGGDLAATTENPGPSPAPRVIPRARGIWEILWPSGRFSLGLYDSGGRRVLSGEFFRRARLDLSGFPRGVYFLRLGNKPFRLVVP